MVQPVEPGFSGPIKPARGKLSRRPKPKRQRIDPERRRIARATSAFLMTRPDLAALTLRFDVMLVAPQRPPRHLAGAWRSDD